MIETGQIDYALVVDGEGTRQIHETTIQKLLAHDATIEDLFENFATLTLGSGSAAMVIGRHSESPGQPPGEGLSGLRRSITNCASVHSRACAPTPRAARSRHRGRLGWEDAGDKEVWFDMRYYILHQVSSVHTQAVIDTLGIDGDWVVRSFPSTATWVRPSRSRSPVCAHRAGRRRDVPGHGVGHQRGDCRDRVVKPESQASRLRRLQTSTAGTLLVAFRRRSRSPG